MTFHAISAGNAKEWHPTSFDMDARRDKVPRMRPLIDVAFAAA